jgi:polyhydroxybutyrate depolymerase
MLLGAALESVASLAMPAPAPVRRVSVTVGGETRDAWIQIPAAAPSGGRYPLVFGFHGGGGAARGYVENSRLLAKAQAAGFIAICPEGTALPLPGDHRIWNSGPEYARASGGADDVLLTRLLIERVAALHPADPDRIYATGFSNGAQMAYRLALELPQIAAIAPMSGGRLALGARPALPVPVLHFHGTADGFYPLEGGLGAHSIGRTPHVPIAEVIAEWIAFDRARATPRSLAHDGWSLAAHDGPSPVGLVLVDGMGHQIAGAGDDRLPGQAMRAAPDAVAMALRFFTDLSLG